MSLFFNREIRIPTRWLVALACGALAVLVAPQAAGHLGLRAFEAELSSALDPAPSGTVHEVSWSFPFQSTRAMVTLTIDDAELQAARGVDTGMIFGSTGALSHRYIARVVSAQAESPVIDRLAEQFRRIRDERKLGSDEYLELLTVGIQSIPYGDTEAETMLAAEMLVEGSGICTDKSLLLGSLLVHEGYDTVMWLFDTQRHVALGVASSRAQFGRTGHAFIETTAIRYVGQASSEYRSLGPVAEPPMQVELGGTKRYHAGEQVEAIMKRLRAAEVLADDDSEYLAYSRLPSLHRERYAQRVIDSWKAEGVVRYVMANAHDREGVYSTLFGSAERTPHLQGE